MKQKSLFDILSIVTLGIVLFFIDNLHAKVADTDHIVMDSEQGDFKPMQLNRTGDGKIIVTGTTMFHCTYHFGSDPENGGLNLTYNSLKYCIGESGRVGCYAIGGLISSYIGDIEYNLNSAFNTEYEFVSINSDDLLLDDEGQPFYDVVAVGYNWQDYLVHSQEAITEYIEAGGSVIVCGTGSLSGEIPFLPFSVYNYPYSYGEFPGPAADPDHPLAQNVNYGEWGYNSELHSQITEYDEDAFYKVWSEGVTSVIVYGGEYQNQLSLTDDNIHEAADLWISDPDEAEEVYGHISGWDVSAVTNMAELFRDVSFNDDISGWNVSNVTNMVAMFRYSNGFDQDLSSWDVSSVTNMSGLFYGTPFNHPLDTWDVSNVTEMTGTFQYCTSFNQDIGDWNTSSVLRLRETFKGANSFDQDLSSWDVSNVSDWEQTFATSNGNPDPIPGLSDENKCAIHTSWSQQSVGWPYDWSGLCAQEVTPITQANIHEAVALWVSDQGEAEATYGHVSDWDVSSVVSMDYLFLDKPFTDDISGWDVSSLENMHGMFRYTSGDVEPSDQFNGDISSWDVSNVTNMAEMFLGNESFQADLSGWDMSSVTLTRNMFQNSNFTGDLSEWDMSNVTEMGCMFCNNPTFNSDLSSWDVSSATGMEEVFGEATSFNSDLSSWDVSSATNMNYLFRNTSSFDQDISGWDIRNVTQMYNIFGGDIGLSDDNKCSIHTSFSSNDAWPHDDWSEFCVSLETVYVPDDNFEQGLIDLGYDDELDDYVYAEVISEVTSLTLIEKGITDLTGIEAFDALGFLNVANNQLESLDVSSNLNLYRLDAGGNIGLTQLEFAENGNITTLNLNGTGFDYFDFSTHTPNLEHLDWCCSGNLTYLDFEGLEDLRWANISSNSLDYLGLGGNEALENLYVNNNNLDSLNLRDAVNLRSFECPNNQLTYLKMSTAALEDFNATENLLACIETPDPEYATENWTYENGNIDEGVRFSDDCAYELLGFITLTPGADPLLMPSDGGTFMYVVEGYHYLETYEEYEASLYVDLPDGERYGPVGGPIHLEVDAGFSFIRALEQRVPRAAPEGEYNFYCLLKSGEEVVDSSGFTFTKLPNNPQIVDPLVSFDHSEWSSYYADNGFQVVSANDIWSGDDLYRADGTPISEMGTLGLDESNVPAQFSLHQNYPNPFNPVTTINYDIQDEVMVTITIHDIMGNMVKSLMNGHLSAGYYSIEWDATDDMNQPVSAGMYFYTIQAGDFKQVKKMLFLK